MKEVEPGDILDGFLIVRVLARSAMGSLFFARQQRTGADVVLKVPHLQFESDVVFYSRFQREERIGLRLDHPAIAKVLAVPEKSRPYIVMEHVEGQTLWETVRTRKPQPVSWVLEMGRQVCRALAYMHREGVVHRDLKPENIVVDAAGSIHIVDFGIALDFSARRITWGRLSMRLGTPEYMAPERIRGKRGDGRTDVYALGVMLYELLAGASPYEGTDALGLARIKRHQDPRPLKDAAPDVDPAVSDVVMRALARDPKERYANAEEMLAVLEEPSRIHGLAPRRSERHGASDLERGGGLVWFMMFCVTLLGTLWMAVSFR